MSLLCIFIMGFSGTAQAQFDNTGSRKVQKKKVSKKKQVKKKKVSKRKAKKKAPKPIRKESKTWDWAAVPVSGLVGFGLGHSLQKRYVKDYGYAFTALDGIIVTFGVFSVFGSCVDGDTSCEDDRDDIADTATSLWWASRLTQAYLMVRHIGKHRYVDHRPQPKFQFAILPAKKGGLQSQFAWNF